MEIIFVIVIFILQFVLCLFFIDVDSKLENKIFLGVIFLLNLSIYIMFIDYLTKPSAIDVYKGRTTLEITYRDNVPVDSVVVWKE